MKEKQGSDRDPGGGNCWPQGPRIHIRRIQEGGPSRHSCRRGQDVVYDLVRYHAFSIKMVLEQMYILAEKASKANKVIMTEENGQPKECPINLYRDVVNILKIFLSRGSQFTKILKTISTDEGKRLVADLRSVYNLKGSVAGGGAKVVTPARLSQAFPFFTAYLYTTSCAKLGSATLISLI